MRRIPGIEVGAIAAACLLVASGAGVAGGDGTAATDDEKAASGSGEETAAADASPDGEGTAGGEEGKKAEVVSEEKVEGRVLPVDFDIRRLDTGLTVALVPFDSPGLAAYFTAMRVGSRDEVEAGHSGFAHLFEHMMFRGTKEMPGKEYDNRVQSLGADSSAWTWNDQTVYFFIAPTGALGEVVAMEAERFRNLHYEEAEFKTESGAVLGEYNKNFSNPINQMEEDLMDLAFDSSTYEHTTMGFLDDIKAMPTMYDYSRKFFARHYVPSKAIVFVVGDFDADAVMQEIRTRYAGWDAPGEDLEIPEEPEQAEERRTHRQWANPVLPQMLVGYKAPAYDNGSTDFAAMTIVGEMLFGKTSPLYRKLVLEDQVAEDVEFWDWPHRDPCLWIFHVKFKKEDFDGVLEQVDRALEAIAAGETTQERLDAVKSHYRYSFVLGMETPRSTANQLAFYSTLDGDPASAEKFLARVEEVGLDDIERVASTYLVAGKRSTVTLAHGQVEGEKGGE